MAPREPSWWYDKEPSWQAMALAPAAALYGAIGARRLRSTAAYRSALPIICVGNFTAGGTGKTPTAIAIAQRVAAIGKHPWFLSRGYGGTENGPLLVEPARHTARDVGDEPLLLARHAPAVIAADRAEGARYIERHAGPNGVIIMDDGLQNPAVAKDLTIALVDRERGLGNGRVIPAGPLRLPLGVQRELTDLIITMGGEYAGAPPSLESELANLGRPILHATTTPHSDAQSLAGQRVLAFAGIANPDRFFALLKTVGADVVATRAFDDHHAFREADAQGLIGDAKQQGALLVTTEKDLVRLSGAQGPAGELARSARAVAISTVLGGDDGQALDKAIARAVRV